MARARRAHGPGRYAAPVAFLVAATVAVLLVRSALHRPAPPARATVSATTTARAATTAPAARTRRTARRFYVVVAGDTFGTIAAKVGASVAQLEQLNPGVASTSLHVGQRLRVR